jgi:putative tryptophan/tyrosine transport system substrate-binding protein
VRRREFVAGLGITAASPVIALAQPNERMRRVGFLSGMSEQDPLAQRLQKIFWQRLAELGWEAGRNLATYERFAAGENARYPTLSVELVNLSPEVIVSNTTPAVAALQHATNRIPIVFIQISDPVAAGFVSSLAHPDYGCVAPVGRRMSKGFRAIAPTPLRR